MPGADAVLQKTQARVVCRSFDCRQLLQQEAQMPPALFQIRLEQQRGRIVESRVRQAERQRIEVAQEGENRSIEQALLAREPDLDPDLIALVPLPSGLDQPVPLEEERRQRYRDTLRVMLTATRDFTSLEELPRDQNYYAYEQRLEAERVLARQPRLQQLFEQLCGLCRGGCCAEGADHAHLSGVALRRVLDKNPDMSEEELVQLYLDYLPEQSMAGACINQTATGCALPRELRSDICNGFFCADLKALQRQWQTRQPERLLVIRRAHHNWNRFEAGNPSPVVAAAWVDEDSVVPIAAAAISAGLEPPEN